MDTSRPSVSTSANTGSVSPSPRQDRPYKGHRQQRLQTAQVVASSTNHEIETSRPQNCRGLSQPVHRAWTRDRVSTAVLSYHIKLTNTERWKIKKSRISSSCLPSCATKSMPTHSIQPLLGIQACMSAITSPRSSRIQDPCFNPAAKFVLKPKRLSTHFL